MSQADFLKNFYDILYTYLWISFVRTYLFLMFFLSMFLIIFLKVFLILDT